MGTHEIGKDDHVYLVDGSGYIFRAYHALPPLTRQSDGAPVGAVSGFCNMLHKLLADSDARDKPTHFAVIFDTSRKTFRNEIYHDYKAHRPPAPEDLVPQFPLVREAVKAFNVACVEKHGFEADDLIATYATQAADQGAKVTIISSDKDLMQLVGDQVEMLDTMKNRQIGRDEVFEKFGVGPDKVIEVQALAGDAVDNVPGVPGIGVKTAAQLINEYGDLDTLLARAEEIQQPKRRENLIAHAADARVSLELVTLRRDVELDVPLTDLGRADPDPAILIGFLKAIEFTTLTRRIGASFDVDVDDIEPLKDLKAAKPVKKPKASTREKRGGALGAVMDRRLIEGTIDPSVYETVTDMEALSKWIDEAYRLGVIAIDTETTGLDAMSDQLVGISLSTEPGKACYIPLAHGATDGLDFGGGDEIEQMALGDVTRALKPMLQDKAVLKVGQNLKFDMLLLTRYGIDIHPIDDTMLMSYALEAGLHGHGMDELSQLHLGHQPIAFKDIAGTGKN